MWCPDDTANVTFNDYDLTSNAAEALHCKHWNWNLSSLCIYTKHAFGQLKGQFPHLQFLAIFDLPDIYQYVEAVMIIHNVVEKIGDDPCLIAQFKGQKNARVEGMQRKGPAQMQGDIDI